MKVDFKNARDLMVENQLRPYNIKDQLILDLFKNTKKEDFLSEEIKIIAYSDLNINLHANRGYLKNIHIAQLIHNADIKKHHKVLHIGGMTGYISVMLANLCREVIVIENHEEFSSLFKKNIKNLGIKNLKIINSPFMKGFAEEAPYDVIFIDNPIDEVSSIIKEQLSFESGNILLIKITSESFCKGFKITKNYNNYTKEFLFNAFSKYRLHNKEEKFIF